MRFAGDFLQDALREDWKGNKEKAIDSYLEYLYGVKHKTIFLSKNRQTVIFDISNRIKDLGGQVPDMT
jgi:hypothetical protein